MRRFKIYLEDNEWKAKRVRLSCDEITQKSSYLKYQTKTAKACVNIQASKVYIFNHNTREEEPEFEAKYTIKELEKFNEYSCSANEANLKFEKLYSEASENYFSRTKQKIQTKNLRISAVVNINENHSLEDIENLAKKIEKIYGLQVLQVAIHRDEGHFIKDINGKNVKDENGDFIFDPNLHAHIEFFTLNKQGINCYKARDRYRINKALQDLASSELKMERGKDYAKLGIKPPKHLNRQEYAVKKATQERYETRLKELNDTNKELRELLKQSGANRSDYAKLEQEVNDYRQKIKNKELVSKDELEKFKNSYIQAINEKTIKITELEAENKTIKEKNEELNSLLLEMEQESIKEVTQELSQSQKDLMFLEQINIEHFKEFNRICFTKSDDFYSFKELVKLYRQDIDDLNISDKEKEEIRWLWDFEGSKILSERYYKGISVNGGFFQNVKDVIKNVSKEFKTKEFNDRVRANIKQKNKHAKAYLELKKLWYGSKDSEDLELKPEQVENLIKSYLKQKKELEARMNFTKTTILQTQTDLNEPIKKKEIER